ncbi:MFS transporter [Levilactobacillus fuyuanensis]|nr:MFS transporter [Levilactobacillus fuyuanensis]
MAMTLLTLGEAIYVPGVPALINAYTIGNEGKYQGLVNAFSSLGKAIGPVMGGLVIGASQDFSRLFLICAVVNGLIMLAVVLGVLPGLKKVDEPL